MPRPAARRPSQSTCPAGSTLKTLRASFPHTRAWPRATLPAPGSHRAWTRGPWSRAKGWPAALAGNRTRVNCLEGSYAHHYTTNAAQPGPPRDAGPGFAAAPSRLLATAWAAGRSPAPTSRRPAALRCRRRQQRPPQPQARPQPRQPDAAVAAPQARAPAARGPSLGGAPAAVPLPRPSAAARAAPPRETRIPPATRSPGPFSAWRRRGHIPHPQTTRPSRRPAVPRAPPTPIRDRAASASPRSPPQPATRQAPGARQEALAGPWRPRTRAPGLTGKGKRWGRSTVGRAGTRRRPAPLAGRGREERKGPGGKRLDRAAVTPATKKGVLPPRRGIEPRSPA